MVQETVDVNLEAREVTLEILDDLVKPINIHNVGVRLWDGTSWPDSKPRTVTLVLRHPGALRAMFHSGTELGLAEAYLYDDFDIEGDIIAVFDLAEGLADSVKGLGSKLNVVSKLIKLPRTNANRESARGPARLDGKVHSIDRDRRAVTYHYDVSNDFYRLWLDKRMIYSCAYFKTPDMSLDKAQTDKLEHICRKLHLQPGQRLLDVGCGWGGLVMYAAEHYGVNALGITLSQPQADLANQHIKDAGLGDRCQVEVRDYRELEVDGVFDALVSVGMFEHVGAELLPVYFRKAYSLLRPGGTFLNHGIARRATDPAKDRSSFSNTYVFPDGELEPISETLHAAEMEKFEVRDVESLREHYALTLQHWVSRLEAHHDEALQAVDEVTYRVWRLYMAASSHGFRTGRLNVYQSLLVRPADDGSSGMPATRMDWYRD